MNLGTIFKNLSDFFEGKKTYIFVIALGLFALSDVKNWIPEELLQYKSEIYIGLLTGAGLSLRKGIESIKKKETL